MSTQREFTDQDRRMVRHGVLVDDPSRTYGPCSSISEADLFLGYRNMRPFALPDPPTDPPVRMSATEIRQRYAASVELEAERQAAEAAAIEAAV